MLGPSTCQEKGSAPLRGVCHFDPLASAGFDEKKFRFILQKENATSEHLRRQIHASAARLNQRFYNAPPWLRHGNRWGNKPPEVEKNINKINFDKIKV